MDAREKENREYKEFLEAFRDRYGAEEENAESVPEKDEPHQAEIYYPQPSRRFSAEKNGRRIRVLTGLVLALLILAVVLIVRSCTGGTDALKGTWDLDGVTAYQFDGKSIGSLNLPDSNYDFTYRIKDDTLTIDFESESARDKTYTFKADKNKLTLSDAESGKTFELTKQ